MIDAALRAPDLIEPVVGFRQWRLRGDGVLRSMIFDEPWPTAALTARCRIEDHPEAGAPSPRCSCGIYAWYGPCPRTASAGTSEHISGAVVMWGRIELHYTGMRAEHCRIVALGLPLRRSRKRDRVLATAERLGVAAVAHGALPDVAARHGAAVPPELCPQTDPAPSDPLVGVVPPRRAPAMRRRP